MIAKLITLNNLTSPSVEINKSNFCLGRNATNDLVIPDIKVSQFHLRIEKKNSDYILTDLSSNGTYVNNNKVGKGNSVEIFNGDILHLLPSNRIKPQEIVGFKFEMIENIQQFAQKSQIDTTNRQHSEDSELKNNTQQNAISQIINQPPPKIEEKIEQQQSQIIQQIEGLEEELECTVCNDYLFEAVSTNPCNHHFCGACLSSWLKKGTKDCPNCRQKLTGVMVARTMNNLVEKWLKGNPRAKRPESLITKMKEENVIYKNPEQYLNLNQEQLQKKEFKVKDYKKYVEEYDSEEDEDFEKDEEDEENHDDDEYLSNNESFDDNNPVNRFQQLQVQPNFIFGRYQGQGFGQPFGQGLFGGLQQFQNLAKACKSCNGSTWKGYQCPFNQQHVGCGSCAKLMPRRELNDDENDQLQMHCAICKAYHCAYYYGDCSNQPLQKFMIVEGLKHQMIIPLNFVNQVEHERLIKHLGGRPHVSIFNFMLENYISKGYFYFEQNKKTFNMPLQELNVKITPKTPICWLCHRKFINFVIFRYIQCVQFDDPVFQSPDCHYGVNCRNQHRDVAHARKYNHVCEQTKFD